MVHFLGAAKPWRYKYNPQTGSVSQEGPGGAHPHQLSFLNLWWDIFHRSILPLYGSIRDSEGQTSGAHTVRWQPVPCNAAVANIVIILHRDRWLELSHWLCAKVQEC